MYLYPAADTYYLHLQVVVYLRMFWKFIHYSTPVFTMTLVHYFYLRGFL